MTLSKSLLDKKAYIFLEPPIFQGIQHNHGLVASKNRALLDRMYKNEIPKHTVAKLHARRTNVLDHNWVFAVPLNHKSSIQEKIKAK